MLRKGMKQIPQSARICTIVVLFAVLLVFYTTLYQVIRQSVEADIQIAADIENLFELTQKKADDQFSALLQVAESVHTNHTLRKVSLHSYNVVDELNAMTEVEQLLAPNTLLAYASYYVRNTQALYTPSGVYPFPESELYYFPYEGIEPEELQQILKGKMDAGKVYLLPTLRSARLSADAVVAVLPIPVNSVSPYATLLIEISQKKLVQNILPSDFDKELLFCCYREDGVLVFSSGEMALEPTGDKSDEGRLIYRADGKDYHLFRKENYGVMKLTYELYVPESAMHSGVLSKVQIKLITIGCAALFLLLCPILYIWAYHPMKLLLESLSGSAGTRPKKFIREDFSIALREIELLRNNNNSLLWKIDMSMDAVRASLLRNLLEYGQTSAAFAELCRRADLIFQYPYFRLVLIAAKEMFSQPGINEYVKLTHENADVYAVKMPDMLYVLVNTVSPETVSVSAVVDEFSKLKITEEVDRLYVERGEWTNEPETLHLSYRPTLDKLSQRIFHGTQGLPKEESLREQHSIASVYPINEIISLRESAMDLDKNKMKENMLDLQRYLLREDTKNTVAVLAVDDVLQILHRYTKLDISSMLEHVRSRRATAASVCQVLRESVEMIEKTQIQTDVDTLTEEMMLYISEMLESPSLSSAVVSEHFGMSESAFSHAFKKRTGSTFIKYVMNLKIQRAKSLLICTDLSVEEIADRLNYSSASSFTRMFKTETQLTPTQYRTLSKNEEA